MGSMELPEILARMQLTLIPTPANGVVYNGFPPENFHHSRTASWFYCPFFLQAANRGVPVLNLHIPQEFTQRYNELLHRAGSSRLLPTLGQLFQTFDAPMHISTALQNALLAHIDQTFGQEMELLLAEIFMQFAPQQYWDIQLHPSLTLLLPSVQFPQPHLSLPLRMTQLPMTHKCCGRCLPRRIWTRTLQATEQLLYHSGTTHRSRQLRPCRQHLGPGRDSLAAPRRHLSS